MFFLRRKSHVLVFTYLPMSLFSLSKSSSLTLNFKGFTNTSLQKLVFRSQDGCIVPLNRPLTDVIYIIELNTDLCCRQITLTSSFTSSQTGKEFQFYHNTTCRSKNIIYLMECRKCKTQYVGESNTA